jgi:hypothetical protein
VTGFPEVKIIAKQKRGLPAFVAVGKNPGPQSRSSLKF